MPEMLKSDTHLLLVGSIFESRFKMLELGQRSLQFSLSSLLVLTLAIAAFLGGRLSRQPEIDHALVQVKSFQSQLEIAQETTNGLWPKPVIRVVYPSSYGNQTIDSGVLSYLRTFYSPIQSGPQAQGVRQKIPVTTEKGMLFDSFERTRRFR